MTKLLKIKISVNDIQRSSSFLKQNISSKRQISESWKGEQNRKKNINTPCAQNAGFSLLGAFVKVWKATISLVMSFCQSVCPSVCVCVRMELFGSHWTDFREIWNLRIFRKSVDRVQVSLKSDKNNGHCIWRPTQTFDNIPLNSS